MITVKSIGEGACRCRDDTKKQQGLGGWRSVLPDQPDVARSLNRQIRTVDGIAEPSRAPGPYE